MNPRVEFNLKQLQTNIDTLVSEVSNTKFIFPVKCCNNKKVINIIANNHFGFDVSNLNELDVIKQYLDGRLVSASGPLSYQLDNYEYENLFVVANNITSYSKGKGLRINFNSDKNFDYSRFGEDYMSLDLKTRQEISYIHFHNSDHKNQEKCNSIYRQISYILESFPNLKHIDIGGHLEDLSWDDGIVYLKTIRKLVPNNINLIVEIGDYLFKKVGKLYCKVVDVRKDNHQQIVTLNFSKMTNQRWAYPVYNSDIKEYKTIFYGCSCCETDIYLDTYAQEIKIGDELIFDNISPYSYQWDVSFNGIDKMEYLFNDL